MPLQQARDHGANPRGVVFGEEGGPDEGPGKILLRRIEVVLKHGIDVGTGYQLEVHRHAPEQDVITIGHAYFPIGRTRRLALRPGVFTGEPHRPPFTRTMNGRDKGADSAFNADRNTQRALL